jgi:hypothetical protein
MNGEMCAEADNVNLLGEHISTVKKSTEASINA